MKYLSLIILIILSSCVIRTGYHSFVPPATTVVFTPYQPLLYRPFRFNYFRPYSLGNVYWNNRNQSHNNYSGPRTNLPLNPHSGPIGGRRK